MPLNKETKPNQYLKLSVCLIVCVTWWCFKPFNCVQIKLLMLDSNIWNALSECKQMVNTK